MKKSILVSVLLASLAVPCLAQTKSGDDTEVEIRRRRLEFVSGMNARNPERVLALAGPDVLLLADGQPAIEGREPLRKMFQVMLESGVTWELKMEPTRIEHSGPLAVEIGRYWKSLLRTDGTSKQSQGKYVDVWKRQPNGSWLLIVHAPSADPPPAFGPR